MLFLKKLFSSQSAKPSSGKPKIATVDASILETAEILAHGATSFPSDEDLEEVLTATGWTSIPAARLRFGVSIANEVLNMWQINNVIALEATAERLIDELHRVYFTLQDKRRVRVGELVTEPDELAYVRQYIERASGENVPNTPTVNTTWWSLMDMVYLYRQEAYVRALQFYSKETAPRGVRPTSFLAMELTTHLTGLRMTSSNVLLTLLVARLDNFLDTYANRARSSLSEFT